MPLVSKKPRIPNAPIFWEPRHRSPSFTPFYGRRPCCMSKNPLYGKLRTIVNKRKLADAGGVEPPSFQLRFAGLEDRIDTRPSWSPGSDSN